MVKSLMFFIWVVDSLIKVTPNSPPPQSLQPPQQPETTLRIECARNEYESGQLVFRAPEAVKRLSVQVSDLKQTNTPSAKGPASIPATSLQARFVGMIPLAMNTRDVPDARLAVKAPGPVPDVLLEKDSLAVPANFSQPVWITLHVPPSTPAGLYRGSVTLDADGQKQSIPLEVTVWDYAIPEQRHLFVTNWLSPVRWAKAHKITPGTPAYYDLISAYAREIAAHRQNVFMVSWRLIKVAREADGRFSYDYADFDRMIETFLKAGPFDRIEISFVARFAEDWHSTKIVLESVGVLDRASGKRRQLPPEEALGPLLADLQRHLDEKGWLDRSMIHVADEASMHNIDSYRQASAFVHQHAPRLRRIDAIETVNYAGALDVWVPKISHLYHYFPWYEQAQRQGNEMWFYVCNSPRGVWMNRYMDYPLIETRLLKWINTRYGITGYLHWGLDAWHDDAFGPQGTESLPPGDTHLIYPGERGPLSSIRWEAERDGIEDYESFLLLEQRLRDAAGKLGPAAATLDPARRSHELCRRLVRSFTDYSKDPAELRAVRATLSREIEQSTAEPLLVWETMADENTPLVGTPASQVVVRGVTRPGATLNLNGEPVKVGADGAFLTATSPRNGVVVLEASCQTEHGAASKTQQRVIPIFK